MARRKLTIDSAELFASSVEQLATRHTCSTRTIKRLREQARAQSDSVVRERIAKRTATASAIRAKRKHHRITATASAISSALTPAHADKVEPTHSHYPAPPPLLPAPQSNAGNDLYDSLALIAALPQATRYFMDGGSFRHLFDRHDDSDLVYDLLDSDLETWLVKFTRDDMESSRADEIVGRTFDALLTHPSTIGFALHPGDGAHTGVHMHILSLKSDPVALAVLQRKINGHPAPQKVRDVRSLCDYFDISHKAKNYCIRYALGGVHFGPAAPPEFRTIIGARLLHTRVTQRNRDLHHVAALAKFLCDRSRTVAGVPASWHQHVEEIFAECALVKPNIDEPHVPDLFRNLYIEARIAWAATKALVAKTTPPAAPWLAHPKYYSDLQSFYDRHGSYSNETRWERATRRARVIDIIRRQNSAQHVDSLEIICGFITHPDYHACLRSERFAGWLLAKKFLFYGLPHLRATVRDTVPILDNPYETSNSALTTRNPMPSIDELRQRMAALVTS